MSGPEDDALDEQFTELLAACDEALAEGRLPDVPQQPSIPPALIPRLRQARHCLERMARHWPTPPPTTARALPAHLGRFVVERLLGQGNFGEVYLVRDPATHQHLALKLLRRLAPDAIARFKREFRVFTYLVHPNLVSLYELFDADNRWFFTMEFVDGVDFLSYVRSPPGVDFDRLRASVAQLTSGVAALHAAGILHRDLKPSNVLVTATGRVKLVDFGLATPIAAVADGGRTSYWAGTAAYMSPEQAASQPLSAASDCYSIGVMLYEALIGRLPDTGDPEGPPSSVQPPPDIPHDLSCLCADLLRRSAVDRPTIRAIRQRLGCAEEVDTGATAVIPAAAAPTVFVGREAELAVLAQALTETRQGRGVVLLIQGPSGIGKSSLLHHFLNPLQRDNQVLVLAGRCHTRESITFQALDGLMDTLARYLRELPPDERDALVPADWELVGRIFPVLRPVAPAPEIRAEGVDPIEAQRRAFRSLRRLLTQLARHRPLVLAIDDLQWGDADSAVLLNELLYPPDPPALLLVGCFRPEDGKGNPVLHRLTELRGLPGAGAMVRELALQPLPIAAACQLAAELLGADAAAGRAQAIADESCGSPLFLGELARYFRMRPRQATAAALEEVIWERIQGQAADARALFEVLAIAGQPIPQTVAYRAAALQVDPLAVLLSLLAVQLARDTGQLEVATVEVYHVRIRESFLGRLAPEPTRQCHSRLAVTMEAIGWGTPETLSVHWQAAGESTKAGAYAQVAGDHAVAALAFDRAAGLYRRALDLQAHGADDERRLRRKLADALTHAGRSAEAATEYLAIPAENRWEALDLRRRAALHYLLAGYIDRGKEVFRLVLTQLGIKLPSSPRPIMWSMLLYHLLLRLRGYRFRARPAGSISPAIRLRLEAYMTMIVPFGTVDPLLSGLFQARGLLLALQVGDSFHAAFGTANQACFWMFEPRQRRQSRRLLRAAEGMAREAADPFLQEYVAACHGQAALMEGRWRTAVSVCDEVADRMRTTSHELAPFMRETLRTYSMWALRRIGALRELAQRRSELVVDNRGRGDLFHEVFAKLNSNIVWLAADDAPGARRELEELLALWSVDGFHYQHWIAIAAGVQSELYMGAAHRAWDRLQKDMAIALRSGLFRAQFVWIDFLDLRVVVALALATAGTDVAGSLRQVERDARSIEKEQMRWSDPLAMLLRAGVAMRRDDRSRAESLLRTAAIGFDQAGMALHAAATRRCLGRLIAGAAGQALVDGADAWMTGQDIRNPARMTAMLAPGFADIIFP